MTVAVPPSPSQVLIPHILTPPWPLILQMIPTALLRPGSSAKLASARCRSTVLRQPSAAAWPTARIWQSYGAAQNPEGHQDCPAPPWWWLQEQPIFARRPAVSLSNVIRRSLVGAPGPAETFFSEPV